MRTPKNPASDHVLLIHQVLYIYFSISLFTAHLDLEFLLYYAIVQYSYPRPHCVEDPWPRIEPGTGGPGTWKTSRPPHLLMFRLSEEQCGVCGGGQPAPCRPSHVPGQLPGQSHLHLLHLEHSDTGMYTLYSCQAVATCTFYTRNRVTQVYSCQAVCPLAPSRHGTQ